MSGYHQGIAQTASALRLRERIARSFGRSAVRYDDHADLQRSTADRLLELLPVGDWQRVLDLGCGTGYCTQQLRQRLAQAEMFALDLAEPMLARTREKLETLPAHLSATGAAAPVHLLCGSAAALPLTANSLDLVVSSLMLQWCSNPAVVFAELFRVLRPGGVALISTFGPVTLQELREAWARVNAAKHSNDFVSAMLLQQAAAAAGFGCTLHDETRIRHYQSLQALARELKGLGANVVSSAGNVTTPGEFKTAAAAFADKRQAQGIPVQWQLYQLVLRKP